MQAEAECLPVIEIYKHHEYSQLQIEGPASQNDLSYFLVNGCKFMKDLEKGVGFDPIILLDKPLNEQQVQDRGLVS